MDTLQDIYTLEKHALSAFNDEHIVPAFLGGKATVPILKRINSTFDRDLDVPLSEDLGVLLTALDARNARKPNQQAQIRLVQSDQGERLRLMPGGILKPAKGPRRIVVEGDKLSINGSFDDRDDLIRALKPHRQALKRPLGEIADGFLREHSTHSERPAPPLSLSAALWGDTCTRALMKILFNLVGYHDRKLATDRAFDAIRGFILGGQRPGIPQPGVASGYV